MIVITRVRSHFCAAHRDHDGRLHGHSYEVWASFPAGADAVDLQTDLAQTLVGFDHSELVYQAVRAEYIAEEIGRALPGCIAVDVIRPVEGLAARWEA